MDVFVGAEYVIGNALIALRSCGIDKVTFSTIRDLGWEIQRQCNAASVDAVLLTSGRDVQEAIDDFSNDFEYANSTEPMIRLKQDVSIETLKTRFRYYLPGEVERIITGTTARFFERM